MKTDLSPRVLLNQGGGEGAREAREPSLHPFDEKVGTAARSNLRASQDWREHPRPLGERDLQRETYSAWYHRFYRWFWRISGMRTELGDL